MSSGTASWLVGSHGSWTSQTVTIAAAGNEIVSTAAGMYLTHATAGISFTDQIAAALTSQLGGVSVCRLNASGKMFMSNDQGNFTFTFTDALGLLMSGFTQGALSGAGSYTADDVSPFLFMPGRTESPMLGRLGSSGRPVQDAVGGVSRDGTTSTRILGEQVLERLVWTYIEVARYWVLADETRHFIGWWKNVAVYGRKFFHYRNVAEDDASTSAVSLGTGLGPYTVDLNKSGGRLPGKRSAGLEMVEANYDIELPIFISPEYV